MASPLSIDLSQIPTSELAREMGRRNPNKNSQTKFRDCRFCGLPFGGVRKLWDHMRVCEKNPHDKGCVYRPCPYCGEQFGARVLRVHKPVCTKSPFVIARAEREAAARKAAEKK
jgi:hypothetical protein